MHFFNDVFDHATWQHKIRDGISGAREGAAITVAQMEIGDVILLYLMRPYSAWIGAMEIVDSPWRDDQGLHGFDDLPFKIPCRFVHVLDLADAVERAEADDYSIRHGGKHGFVRFSPIRLDQATGESIFDLLESQAAIHGDRAAECNAAIGR